MEVISTNIANPTTIMWRGKKVQTGLYKKQVHEPIFLGTEDVENDYVVDRRYHGGNEKACYIYSLDHYPYWKEKYPDLDWSYGMFGENLTVKCFSEDQVKIGSIYKIGEARVQITRPRQPCYKLGVRFGTQKMIKQFIDSKLSGVYVKVLNEGNVTIGDCLELEEEPKDSIYITELNTLLFHYNKEKHELLLKKAIENPYISESDKNDLRKYLK